MQNNKNEHKGYSLFKDVEDVGLRTRNRAVVMANIAEFNTKAKKISPKGASLILGYFNEIPAEERLTVHERFEKEMEERGYRK